jgi:two-component system, sensor histidine kinase
MSEQHRLLKRQIRKFFGDAENIPEDLLPFLGAVNQSYIHHESDRSLIERTMEISSKELTVSNKKLLDESKKQKFLINALKESLQSMTNSEVIFDDQDLLKMADLLQEAIEQRKIAEAQIMASEEKYRGIIENMDLGMLETDADGKIVLAHPRFLKLTGYKAKDLVGKDPKSILVNRQSEKIMLEQEESRRKGEYGVYEIQLKKKNGDPMWVIVSRAPIFNENKEFTGALGIHFDISHRKQIESDLQSAKAEAEALLKSKELFLANISHEIRTPMNAILGMSRLISETPLNSTQHQYLSAINTSAHGLMVIINDVLDMSKINAGKFTIETIDLDIDSVLNSLHQSLSFKAEEKGIYLHCKRDPRIQRYLKGDPTRLSQILTNLVSNAIKFTASGGVDVYMELIETRNGADKIQFSVKDTGVGIDTDKLKSVFQSFTQEDETITRKYGGTGLGLAIAKQLVELFGGSFEVASKKGVGSTFSFTIHMAHGQEIVAAQKTNYENKDLKGARILLVEDNEINQFLAVTILKKWNAVIETSMNGIEALDALSKNTFDLILMDMQMPEMDGIQATQIIRKDLKLNLPIIALTANAIKGEKDKCLEAGMTDYVSKPFDQDELYAKIVALSGFAGTSKKSRKPKVSKEKSVARFSLERLLKMFQGETHFVHRTVEIFLTQFHLDIAELVENFENGNLHEVRHLAHKIKPNIDLFEIKELKKVVRSIEQYCYDGTTTDLGNKINTLSAVMHEVSLEMKASINQ